MQTRPGNPGTAVPSLQRWGSNLASFSRHYTRASSSVLYLICGSARYSASSSTTAACESERHTAENIKKWTKEALESIGLTTDELLQVEKPVESD